MTKDEQYQDKINHLSAVLVQRDMEIDLLRKALLRVAFDSTLSDLAAKPSQWPYTVAYLALGGRIIEGVQIDQRRLLKEALYFGISLNTEQQFIATQPKSGDAMITISDVNKRMQQIEEVLERKEEIEAESLRSDLMRSILEAIATDSCDNPKLCASVVIRPYPSSNPGD